MLRSIGRGDTYHFIAEWIEREFSAELFSDGMAGRTIETIRR